MEVFPIHKEETFYNDDGEKVFSRSFRYKGRFHDKGYTLYAHGNTISSRKSAVFPKEINLADIGRLVLLSRYLLPNINVIGYVDKKGNQSMDIKRISKVLSIKERQTYRYLDKMIKLQLIAKDNNKYYINPLYFLNGKAIHDDLYWLFKNSLDSQLSAWIKDTYLKRQQEREGQAQ